MPRGNDIVDGDGLAEPGTGDDKINGGKGNDHLVGNGGAASVATLFTLAIIDASTTGADPTTAATPDPLTTFVDWFSPISSLVATLVAIGSGVVGGIYAVIKYRKRRESAEHTSNATPMK